MMNMLQPSSQGRAKAALKHIGNKPNEYHYEEGKFNRFLSKIADGASNTFGEALQSMSTTYKQIEDLKKERESELKNRIFNQNLKDITRELENLAPEAENIFYLGDMRAAVWRKGQILKILLVDSFYVFNEQLCLHEGRFTCVCTFLIALVFSDADEKVPYWD
ncbi:unnamed protein product [Dibothriocephalus latus]|uniref:Uncharacterized protein n=1 Tax=Dibothriocephalus latus TaxID=60516 RepID=A0A3P7KW46_DIBLA|nr:unnamed protein product [Dibothriocephalus latus]